MRRLRNLFITPVAISVCALLCSCGGDSDATPPNPEPTLLTGIFSDSPVSGLGYESATQSGVTGENGEFRYYQDETLVFFIGGTAFPAVAGQAEVTPQTLYNHQSAGSTEVVNTLRLLQTLDSDNNPENGIQLEPSVHDNLASVSLDVASAQFDQAAEAALQAAGIETPLVSEDKALAHYVQGRPYQQADLTGPWFDLFYNLPVSDNVVDGFAYAVDTLKIDTDGTTVATALVKSGDRELDTETIHLTLGDNGQLALADAPEWEAYLSERKNQFVAFARDGEQIEIGVALKQAEQYQQSDLAGMWYSFGLEMPIASPFNPDLPLTYLDRWQIDDEGGFQLTELYTFGYDVANETETLQVTLTESGQMVIDGDDEGIAYLGRSKDVLVRHEHWPEGSALIVALKQPEAITLADLQGTWRVYSLGLPPEGSMDPDGFTYDVDEMVIDAEGNVAGLHLRHLEWEREVGIIDESWTPEGQYPNNDSWIDGAWQDKVVLLEGGLFASDTDSVGFFAINQGKDMLVNLFEDEGNQGMAIAIKLAEGQ
ncbi:hypothetical protein KUV89_08360 [Marinobacter hydrocarbonoclasticus]|nr:hypothetical protein [Marinobacter nauticus]